MLGLPAPLTRCKYLCIFDCWTRALCYVLRHEAVVDCRMTCACVNNGLSRCVSCALA